MCKTTLCVVMAHLILRGFCCWLPCISHLHLSSVSLICISPPFFSDSAPFGCASKLSHSADAKLFPLGKLWSRYQQIKFTLVLSLNNSQSDSQDKKFNELPCHFPKNCYVLQCGTQKQSCIVLKEFCGGFCCFFC